MVVGAQYASSAGAEVYAIDAATGKPAAGFGENGAIAVGAVSYGGTPTIYRNVAIIGQGSAVLDKTLKEQKIQLFKGKGCQTCNFTGMKGRVAIYEVMPISEQLRDMILHNAPTAELREGARTGRAELHGSSDGVRHGELGRQHRLRLRVPQRLAARRGLDHDLRAGQRALDDELGHNARLLLG